MTPGAGPGPSAEAAAEAAAHAVRKQAAKGAGTVALSRLGAVVEVVSQPAYTWMFGLPTYGLYMVLWSLVNLVENIFDLGVTSGLQRILPACRAPEERARAVRAALILGILPNFVIGALACLFAPQIAALLNVAAQDSAKLVTGIRLFAWALPLWATIEVATSAVRANHAFGPEVRVRLMWEQLARLIAAVLLWAAGIDTLGLLLAHLISLAFTAGSALRLLNRYVPLRDVVAHRAGRAMNRDMLLAGLSVLPANILARTFSDLATIIANLLAPGAAGASAAGLYAIARKVSSIPQIVRQTFGYVLGPIAAAAQRGDRSTLQALYDFAVRLSLLLAVPTCVALAAAGPAILGSFAHGAEAGLPILIILVTARGIEAAVGPASSIQQVIGRRVLPLQNSLVAVIAAAAVLAATAGRWPGLAVALAVGTGQVVVAALSIGQLSREEGLVAFAPPFLRTLGLAIGASAAIIVVALITARAPLEIGGIATFLAWMGALWLALRLGLADSDKRALGKTARRLNL
ncbi:polysaccharide biosynthesis protein [Sphingomonas sp. BIUV-7]|uniref:Polysaccharide biosynthesis protein n=1 Tax=Sphingomonas natans TaxID=3063330 RepID=A0ABT8Y9U7_9SPHN|nr:oligosaccharide flippase family protein [Sphingomonas sp. BIUV-7]MDO6415111.1 polysaccharide biosynthesis protein [Sphingomonas sp. BIUV-7]